MLTADAIAANKQRVSDEAMAEVLPSESGYTDVTDQYTGGDSTVLGVYQAGEDGYVVGSGQLRLRRTGEHDGGRGLRRGRAPA